MHSHGTPGISHTPDWVEKPSAGSANLVRNLTGQNQRHSSPFATPVPQQKQAPHPHDHSSSGAGTLGINSDGATENEAALPSSVLAAPPTTPRQGDSSIQTSPITFPKPRENGTGVTEFLGFRNISGISGVSTIDAPETIEDKTSLMPPALSTEESSGAQQVFDTSQIHRHPEDEKREVYATTGFIRPPEGAFGTPAPLHAPASSNAAP